MQTPESYQNQNQREAARAAQAKRAARKRKGRMSGVYLLVLLFIVTVGVGLSLTVFFHIEDIFVVGDSRYTTDEIVTISGIEADKNLFTAKTKRGQKNIEEQLPYIETARIVRRFPSGIRIEVTEAVAVGVFEQNGGFVLVNKQGKALEQVTEKPEGLALLSGFVLTECKVGHPVVFQNPGDSKTLENVLGSFEENNVGGITKISLVDSVKLTAVYEDRILINFGAPVELAEKMSFLTEYFKANTSEYDKGVLDISNPKKGYMNPTKTFEGQAGASSAPEETVTSEAASTASE